MPLVAGFAPPRNAGKIEHVEEIGIGKFVLQCEADGIEGREGAFRFERDEGDVVFAQQTFQIGPRRIDAFGGAPVEVVEDMIKDRQAEVAHADFVDVGKCESDARLDLLRLFLDDAAGLAAEIAGGAIDQG
jgi:hypothetical protein